MKKNIIMICLILFTISLPINSAITSSSNNNNEIKQMPLDNPPDWASGSFKGIVGMTSDFGKPGPYGAYIAGYYENDDFKGKIAGVMAKRESTEITGFLKGYLGGPFIMGMIGNMETKEYSLIVGIGVRNETHVYFRIVGLYGPTFYMAGKYQSL